MVKVMKIALTKMNQVWENKQENMKICNNISMQAASKKIDLLIFPEMTLTGFTLKTLEIAECFESSESIQYFSDLARAMDYFIIAGLVVRLDNFYYNLASVHNSKGELICKYSKSHPFSPGGESLTIKPGDSPSFFEVNDIKFALTICYDLRFSGFFDALADKTDCIVNIANWPAQRVEQWKVLLRARAIENQVYIIGVNRIGKDGNNLTYVESSYCFGPDGNQVETTFSGEYFDVVEIDKQKLLDCRIEFPLRRDKRRDFYNSF